MSYCNCVTNKIEYMNKKKQESAKVPNAVLPAFPSYNADGVYQPGVTKTEWATALFVSAHIQAHGSSPSRDQLEHLAQLATMLFNSWIEPPAIELGDDQDEPEMPH
jgi:hypothetical protein